MTRAPSTSSTIHTATVVTRLSRAALVIAYTLCRDTGAVYTDREDITAVRVNLTALDAAPELTPVPRRTVRSETTLWALTAAVDTDLAHTTIKVYGTLTWYTGQTFTDLTLTALRVFKTAVSIDAGS